MTDMSNLSYENQEQPAVQPPVNAHALYQQVETLINQGNWQAAHAPLAELIALYPDDEYLQELAHSVRTRSALLGDEGGQVSIPDQSARRSHRLRIALLSLFVLLFSCVLIGGGTLVVWGWVLPQWQDQRQATRISQLQEEARNALASGDYDRAVLAFNGILELQPGDEQAQVGLEHADQLRATASLYSEAIIEMEAYRWDNALAILHQLEAEQPGYRDVTDRISFIQEQQNLSALFEEAEAAFNQADYKLAIQKYESLQSLNYSFQSETVQNRLFLSYLQLGLAQEEAAGSNPEQFQEALSTLEKALALRPDDSRVRGETQLIKLYLSGLEEFEAKNWAQAVADLAAVYEARPEFAGGTVGRYLFEAYLAWGDELYAEERYEEALARYDAAGSINGTDRTKVNARIVTVEVALTPPTPTPTPTPQPARAAAASYSQSAAPPPPTATPLPSPYTVKSMSVRNNCSGNGYIHGVVWNAYGMPLPGVTVRAFNTTTGAEPLISNPTSGDGIYQIILNGDQIPGLWMVQILDDNSQPVSEAWGQHLGGECLNGAQELKTDWQRALLVGE